jgi:hypothetical protein
MKLTESEYRRHCNDYDGYCTECDAVTQWGDTEPDTRFRACPECEAPALFGVEEAAMRELIEIMEDESDPTPSV